MGQWAEAAKEKGRERGATRGFYMASGPREEKKVEGVEWLEREEIESGLRDGLPNEILFLLFQSHQFKSNSNEF